MYYTTKTKLLGVAVIVLSGAFLVTKFNHATKHHNLEYHTHDVKQRADETYYVSWPKNPPFKGGDYLYLSGAWF